MTNPHPLAALIAGVPRRYDIDPVFNYLREDLVLAALEAAETESATLRAEVERLRGAATALCDAIDSDDYYETCRRSDALRAELEGKV